MQIILDTNFLISVIINKIQLFEELKEKFPENKVVVPLEAIKELEVMSEDPKYTMKEREAADLAIFMIKKKNISLVILGTKDVDAGIIRYSMQNENVMVATLDRELKAKIKAKTNKIKFLTIKEKKRIELQ